MKYQPVEPMLTLLIQIEKLPQKPNKQAIYRISTQWSDNDNWNPSAKNQEVTVGSPDVMLNLMQISEVTFCNQITVLVLEDETLRHNLKVLSGQTESTTQSKSKVLNQVSYNPREKANLLSFFRRLNIVVI